MPEEVEWILLGDFNLLRSPSDRNRPGGDINEMLFFNEATSALGVFELPLLVGNSLGLTNNSLLC